MSTTSADRCHNTLTPCTRGARSCEAVEVLLNNGPLIRVCECLGPENSGPSYTVSVRPLNSHFCPQLFQPRNHVRAYSRNSAKRVIHPTTASRGQVCTRVHRAKPRSSNTNMCLSRLSGLQGVYCCPGVTQGNQQVHVIRAEGVAPLGHHQASAQKQVLRLRVQGKHDHSPPG